MSPAIYRVLGALSLASLLAVVSACATSSTAGTTAAAPAAPSAGKVLNLGDHQQELGALLSVSGALAGAPYKVNFIQFDSGPLVDAGFAAHRIDVGSMGDLPASLAVKSGLPVKAVAVDLPTRSAEYMVSTQRITGI